MQQLPLDTSTFSRLREFNYIYVDKTEYIYRMLTQGHRFFLSRPRRFGKSLLVSTLYEVLTAHKSLFKDLWIAKSNYHWNEYGVINLDFSRLAVDDIPILKQRLYNLLNESADAYKISLDIPENAPDFMLEKLIKALYDRFGRVAILIDEYDSPILKTLHDQELAQKVRDTIQYFFTIIKALDQYIQFVFITGVSSFAKAGLFSGINNLQILTLRDEYGAICGYTDEEIDHYFHEHIEKWAQKKNISFDKLRKQIKQWYNGYRFGIDVPPVYNPFSLMNALHISEFENFWFQSGTPKFLIDTLKKEHTEIDFEKRKVSKDFLGVFDINTIPPLSLMFQAGYLTIIDYDSNLHLLTLDYPNEEVRVSFQKYLFEVFAHIQSTKVDSLLSELRVAFEEQDIDEIVEILKRLFAHIPYQLHMKEEKFYHALLMMICVGARIKAQSEYSTNIGSIDLVLELAKCIYVIEIKFNKPAKKALEQIKIRKYYERFLDQGKPIILLGLSFKRKPGQFDIAYVVEKLN